MLPLLTWFLPNSYLGPQLRMVVVMNSKNMNPIHKKTWYYLTFWDGLISWPDGPHILPGPSTHWCVIRHGMLSVPERPCGPWSWVSDTPMILTSLPGGLPSEGNGKSSRSKVTASSLLTHWRPSPSPATPFPDLGEVPTSRLLGRLASPLGAQK